MAIRNASPQSLRQTSPQVTKANRIPAPVKGIDARTVLSQGDPMFCIYAYNLLPNEYGMRVRRGFREWQLDVETGPDAGLGVGTIIPYGSTDTNTADDRLFAVTNEGVWDVTIDQAAPILALDFSLAGNGGDTSAEAGHGVYTQFTTDADAQILFYADSANGLFTYTESTDTWARATGITGPTVENVVFVMTHKSKLWMVERDSSSAWYLPDGFVTGAADQFFFGSKFKHGGNVAGLFNWTIDGGAGVDDYFVAVSRAGDVVVYQGDDVSSADGWNQAGQYFMGAVPKGNQFGTEDGGDLYFMSVYGLISMDEIIKGVDGKNVDAQTDAAKVAILIRRDMDLAREEFGWDIKRIPSLGSLMVSIPPKAREGGAQLVLNTVTRGWGFWRGVPMTAFDEWDGSVFFGSADNKIYRMDVDLDNVLITPDPESPINGLPIDFSVLTTYQDLGEPALFKRVKYVRSEFIATVAPAVSSTAHYDYNLDELLGLNAGAIGGAAFWDVDLWDVAVWNATIAEGFNTLSGSWGMGRTVAIAMRGNSTTQTTCIGWDVMWDSGAPL